MAKFDGARMTQRLRSISTLTLPVCRCLFLGGIVVCTPAAWSQKPPIRIEVRDRQGARIASTDSQAASSRAGFVTLLFEREYQPGDRVVVSGPRRIDVQLDEKMPECRLVLAGNSTDGFSFEIPYGSGEAQTGSAYAPEAFADKAHRIVVRAWKPAGELNLALNPCDQADVLGQKPAQAFPHASSDSVTRNSPEFQERNAIDGVAQNGHHGAWPYQSWGPERRDDLWWKVDFGRMVEVKKLRLMIRADFPHDSYWQSAVVEFSDGGRLPIQIVPSAGFQEFSFTRRRVTWLRLTELVPADRSKYSGLVEVEAWGRDIE
jgi:hypothetical protein